MALIGTIRKNFWFVLILLGFALAAFILMDMDASSNRSGGKMTMGEVAGQEIDYKEFNKAENATRELDNDLFGRRERLWDYFVEKAIIEDQSEDLGLAVSKAELMDLQFGNRLSPVITGSPYYRNQQTGQFDRQTLLGYKQRIESDELLTEEFENFWKQQENQIVKTELQSKIGNLVSKAIFTPNFLVEETGAASNSSLNMSMVKIPFDAIDMDVEVSDADITAFMNEDPTKYTSKEETRVIEYAVIDVIPTATDSTDRRDAVVAAGKLLMEASAQSDSVTAINNGGFYSNVYFGNDALPSEGLKGKLFDTPIGSTYGPYEENGAYIVAKLIDKKVMPDSVESKHILKRITTGTPEDFAAAEAFIDSLQNELNRGAKFSELAEKHSDDPSTSIKGGDFGTLPQGVFPPQMKSLGDAIFNGREGRVYKVKTQIGMHLVKVEDQIYNNRDDKFKIAIVQTPITPSERTQNDINDVIDELITKNRDMATMRQAASELGYNFQSSGPLTVNDYSVGTLGADQSSREMVKWAYESDTEINEVSPTVYSYTDKINYFDSKYVIAALKSTQNPGMFSAESMRNSLETTIKNRKKAESILGSLGTDLAAAAAKYGVEVETKEGVSMGTSSIAGIGKENQVIAKAFATAVNETSAVVGSSGVFLVSPTNITEGTVGNLPQMRQLKTRSSRNQAELKTLEALKKSADVADNRATFF